MAINEAVDSMLRVFSNSSFYSLLVRFLPFRRSIERAIERFLLRVLNLEKPSLIMVAVLSSMTPSAKA